ncbi:hypothetical protein FB45DRAFT_453441 [Roridomyces roridus]|uniref:Azaphilone pigments biosynthesis cluster protein L N-terminal domain-containing protein n=1 Tax=Roridomyces roridus TaxID=1738132 RepID=A0AAD7C280_9AGAR|nr:hypothetical protein FB45DRAFT_453441 [Roridomyces roridus]
MSFGFGLGDIALVTQLTWKLYKGCKDSPRDFQALTNELGSLNAVLGETRDYVEEYGDELPEHRIERLNRLLDTCRGPLEDLEALLRKYNGLATQSQRTWDRMRFGMKDLSDVRQKLISSTTLLTSFNSALLNSSTARIEKRLNKFITEVQAGMREGSVISSTDVASTIESPEVWAEVRRELEDVGITAAVVEERHEFILTWIKNAVADGALEGVGVVEISKLNIQGIPQSHGGTRKTSLTLVDDEGVPDSPNLTPTASRCHSPTGDDDLDSNLQYHSAASHFGHDEEDAGRLSAATYAFDAELQRTRNSRAVTDLFDPLAASTMYSLSPPSDSKNKRPVPTRRRTFGMVEKLFQKQTAIVQAASDGDIDRVAKLISMGMDVNVRDRWGWSALSMCGYGGHAAIARILLDHGANIDNMDVDGDTPMSLAAQRGHADLVIMFEEEEAIRKVKEAENAKEKSLNQ